MSGDWIKGPLVIRPEVLADMHDHALACYPEECCGFGMGPTDDVGLIDASVREENEANKFHKIDPETFPRTAKTYFKINELRASRTFDQAARQERPVKVIYHSHCDAGAYFSKEDASTFARNNTLMWPVAFVVVSVLEGKVADTKVWVHKPDSNEFVESSFSASHP